MKQKIYFLRTLVFFVLLFLLAGSDSFAQRPFITVWKTDNPGASGNNQVQINATGNVNYTWEEDGNSTNAGSGAASNSFTITFPHPGTYRIFMASAGGASPFGRFTSGTDSRKLLRVEQWGDIHWTSFEEAFSECHNLTITATDAPDLESVTNMRSAFSHYPMSSISGIENWDVSKVENMSYMFSGAANFNQSLNDWNVGNVTDMSGMFSGAYSFNEPLDGWDVGKVRNMSWMFYNATNFNQNLNTWNVGIVEDMGWMFMYATNFNQPLNNWNVGSVSNMQSMFGECVTFNQPLNDWDVSSVTNMGGMFTLCETFNQPLNDWNVSNVTDMTGMFDGASAFNQPLNKWNVSNVYYMEEIFHNATSFNQSLAAWNLSSLDPGSGSSNNFSFSYTSMSCENYSLTLQAWAENSNTVSDIVLEASGIEYSPDIIASRNYLIGDLNWTIQGDVPGSCELGNNPPRDEFITIWQTDAVRAGGNTSGISNDNQIYFPATGDFTYTWAQLDSDGNETGVTGSGAGNDYTIITFPAPGTYRMSVDADDANGNPFTRFGFDDMMFDETIKIIGVENWGSIIWSSMENAFWGAENLEITATDIPNLSNVSDMSSAFSRTKMSTIPNINSWDVSNVESMYGLFEQASNFNQPLDNWDVSNVKNMGSMFSLASSFNQPLATWNVGSVTNMDLMFQDASSFNQPLDNWNVGNVTSMFWMFFKASNFNQPLNEWDVSKVRDMSNMFYYASNFDQPLNKWNLKSLEHQTSPPSGSYDFSFGYTAMSCENYSLTLSAWAGNPDVPVDIVMDATTLTYATNASAARDHLINDLGWTISGDVLGTCTILPVRLISFSAQAENNEVKLQWASADERNFKGYSVERSSNAGEWNEIGFVSAKVNGAANAEYAFYDRQPLSGTGYYRLKLVDQDGSFTYSEIRKVTFMGNVSVSVYPNPSRNFVTVTGLAGKSVIRLMDINGRVLQTISASSTTERIDVSTLTKGMYNLVIVSGSGQVITKKIMKE